MTDRAPYAWLIWLSFDKSASFGPTAMRRNHRGHVLALDVPDGTEYNADGEIRSGGLERVTAEPDAYALVAGG